MPINAQWSSMNDSIFVRRLMLRLMKLAQCFFRKSLEKSFEMDIRSHSKSHWKNNSRKQRHKRLFLWEMLQMKVRLHDFIFDFAMKQLNHLLKIFFEKSHRKRGFEWMLILTSFLTPFLTSIDASFWAVSLVFSLMLLHRWCVVDWCCDDDSLMSRWWFVAASFAKRIAYASMMMCWCCIDDTSMILQWWVVMSRWWVVADTSSMLLRQWCRFNSMAQK